MIIPAKTAVNILKNSGIVAIPTETVYGLAAVATNEIAVNKIYVAKNRPKDNPLICHFCSLSHIKEYVDEIPLPVEKLIKYFTPGPISFLLKLPEDSQLKFSTCGLNTVICRIPDHWITLQIIKEINQPLAAPSANTSTKFSATSAMMVEKDLGSKIDGVIDGGSSKIGLESTILDCTQIENGFLKILRPGAIGKKEIEKFLFESKIKNLKVIDGKNQNTTPGSKYRHYAPKTPIYKIEKYELNNYIRQNKILNQKFAILGLSENIGFLKKEIEQKTGNSSQIYFIELGNDSAEVAEKLYQKLFELDNLNVNRAFIQDLNLNPSSETTALYDRLSKIITEKN